VDASVADGLADGISVLFYSWVGHHGQGRHLSARNHVGHPLPHVHFHSLFFA
jgi:hypothetical protein